MLAIYTCSTSTGKSVKLELSDKTCCGDIKLAARDYVTTDVKIVDVIHEQLLGDIEDEDEE